MGYIEKHALVRTRTKHRMKKRLKEAHECYLKGKMDAAQNDQRLQSGHFISCQSAYAVSNSQKCLLGTRWIVPAM